MVTLTKPPANILELPLAQRAEMALKAAVEKVVEEHVRDGRPLYIWRDGKVAEVSAQELREQPHGRNRSCATCSQSMSISALRLRRG